jgi:heptosyltransferase-3
MRKRLLVIFPGALGDLLCALPAIRTITQCHPEADLELMARAELARFAVGRLNAVHAHSIDRRETGLLFVPSADLAPARAFFGNFNRIYSFFAADDADFRASLAAVSNGIVTFIPFRPTGDGHIAACYLREAVTPASDEHEVSALSRIEVLPEDLDAADELLAAAGLQPNGFLLILPGSGSPAKNWPPEHFADLAALLAPQLPCLVVIGPAEAALTPVFRSRELTTLDHLELGTVAGLARRARAFVGNDSGISHLAASASASGLALFGPTDPGRWRPLGRVEVLRREPLSALPVEDVAARVISLGISLASEAVRARFRVSRLEMTK